MSMRIPHLRFTRHENMFGICRNITATVVQYDEGGRLVSQHRFGGACRDSVYRKAWVTSVVRESGTVVELGDLQTIAEVEQAIRNEFDADYAAQIECVRDAMEAA